VRSHSSALLVHYLDIIDLPERVLFLILLNAHHLYGASPFLLLLYILNDLDQGVRFLCDVLDVILTHVFKVQELFGASLDQGRLLVSRPFLVELPLYLLHPFLLLQGVLLVEGLPFLERVGPHFHQLLLLADGRLRRPRPDLLWQVPLALDLGLALTHLPFHLSVSLHIVENGPVGVLGTIHLILLQKPLFLVDLVPLFVEYSIGTPLTAHQSTVVFHHLPTLLPLPTLPSLSLPCQAWLLLVFLSELSLRQGRHLISSLLAQSILRVDANGS